MLFVVVFTFLARLSYSDRILSVIVHKQCLLLLLLVNHLRYRHATATELFPDISICA